MSVKPKPSLALQWGPFDTRSTLYFALTSGLLALVTWLGFTPSEEVKTAWVAWLVAVPTLVTGGRAFFRLVRDNRTAG